MNSKTKSASLGILEVLLIIFVVLKLFRLIDQSWWWVLSPLWIPLGLAAIALAVLAVVVVVQKLTEEY